MKVKELRTRLLEEDMNSEIKIAVDEPHDDGFGGTVNGYLFDIDEVRYKSYGVTELKFTDYRKEE